MCEQGSPPPPTWADRYRAACLRCTALADAETDDLTREALRDAAAKYIQAALEHEEIALKALKRAAALLGREHVSVAAREMAVRDACGGVRS